MQKSIVFHVYDNRLDRIASFEFAPDAASHTALLPGFENFNIGHIVTAIAEIHITTFGALPS